MLEIVSNAEVGQSMISTAQQLLTPAIQIDQNVIHNGTNLGRQFTLTIPQGILPLKGLDDGGKFYQSEERLTFYSEGQSGKVTGGIFIPDDKTKPTEIFWLAPNTITPLNDIHQGISFKPTISMQSTADSFKRELVYSGVSQNTISILYREFLNDMARPAFSQELKYDLSQGRTIGYKGARFEVIKADNLGITYKVLKALD